MLLIIGLIYHLFANCCENNYVVLDKNSLNNLFLRKDCCTESLAKPNIFNDCRINKALLTKDIQQQLLVKKLDSSSLEFLKTNTVIFENAWQEFSGRFSNKRLLKVFETTNKTLLYTEGTVIFSEDPEQLKEIAYHEWMYLDKKKRSEFKLFLASHEKFLNLYRTQFPNTPSNELMKALKSFSYRYLLILNIHTLAVEHKKELKKMEKPFSFYNCVVV